MRNSWRQKFRIKFELKFSHNIFRMIEMNVSQYKKVIIIGAGAAGIAAASVIDSFFFIQT